LRSTRGFCTTLSCVAFTDRDSMIGDAVRIQIMPRLMPAACSLTRIWSVCFPLRAAASTGSEHLIVTHCESREHCVDASRSLIFWVIELKSGKSYDFKFVTFTDTYRVWSGRCLLFPKSEPDLTVDLSNCVIDVSSRFCLLLHATQWSRPLKRARRTSC